MRIHLLPKWDEQRIARLQNALGDAVTIDRGGTIPDPAAYDVIVGKPGDDELKDWLTASPSLRAIVQPWAGIGPNFAATLSEFPNVTLHNLHHNAAPTAEEAMALLMAASKHVVFHDSVMRDGYWPAGETRYRYRSLLLDGAKCVVLGYGAIGRRVAAACVAMGMVVSAIRRSVNVPYTDDAGVRVVGNAQLREAVKGTDALIVTLPLTPETEGCVDATLLRSMAEHGVVVNIGRGAVVDEAALYGALRDGHLAAAGIDVWWQYGWQQPDAPSNQRVFGGLPWHELPNVVLSPHRGGLDGNPEVERRREAALIEVLTALRDGDGVPNRVDASRGY